MSSSPHSRRAFLGRAAALGLACALPGCQPRPDGPKVRFGVITDVHQDLIPDGPDRLAAFLAAMRGADVDFIVQLGDFCIPHPRNQAFMDVWRSWPGPSYHVLGNHDFDGGYRPEQVRAFYGMAAAYYRFEAAGVAFFVLDGNEPGGKAKGYKRYIGPAQLAWLESGLRATPGPKVVLVHQPLDDPQEGIENGDAVRAVLERHGALACLSGHHHQDYLRLLGGVAHLQVNSASYYWIGDKVAARETLSPEMHRAFPALRYTALYREPLWALVTLDLARGELAVAGRATEWVGPDPWARGAPPARHPRADIRPAVSARRQALG
jgi:calcineurin-like phosphoesterase family protein